MKKWFANADFSDHGRVWIENKESDFAENHGITINRRNV